MRRIPLSGLNSHVARRLFILFLVAALLPVGGVAYFAYAQVGDMLIDLNYRGLRQDAKAVGMGLVQRLIWREQALKRLAQQLAVRDGSGGTTRIQSRIEGFGPPEIVGQEVLVGLAPAQIDHLRRANVVLLRLSDRKEPIMLAAITGSSDLIRVRLDTASLWYDEEAAGNYCILTSLGIPLYCTPKLAPPPSQWLAPLAGQNSGVFPWQVDGEEHLAAYWRAQLQASLANDGFIVVVSDEKKNVLAVLTRFRQMFPAIFVLALALAAWLSIGQIRRQMRPLELLEEGTRRLAQGAFSSRVEITGNDEFAMLAESFNRMAERLDNKFHLLQALGELDQAILAVAEIDHVIRLLLQHVPRAVPCAGAGVLRFDDADRIRLLIADDGQPGAESVQPQAYSETIGRPAWAGDSPWFLVDLATPGSDCLQYFAARGATVALIFPARIGERLNSALVLAYRELPEDTDEIVQAGRTLADRLAAAQSNIAWEGKLYHQAHYDALTDLPNRVLLRDRLEQALLRAKREGLAVAAMLVDLDDFKQVNDSLGHSAGDMLLMSVAERLKKMARLTDTVARLGGDEFVILIPDLPRDSAISSVDRIARALSEELALPLDIGGRRVSSPVSIGIALFPDNADGVEELLKTADAAMYESKRHQRGGYRFYNSRMNAAIVARFELAQELREAMEQEEFLLVYQPKVDAVTGRLVGAEALIRWKSPKRGLVSPALFIPVIDEIGLGSRLGAWVLNAACAQMAAWDATGCPSISVSVNVSPAQFHSGEIVAQVREALGRSALDPQRLELEILESMAVSDSSSTNAILVELREMGIGIALDDFGTGYSSLVYLTQLPVNVLKIDRGFIVNLLSDERQQMIVERIISLAKALRYTVVAEGVEEEAQMRMLAAMGCDVFQGYLFSRPLDVDGFVAFMNEATRRPATAVLSS